MSTEIQDDIDAISNTWPSLKEKALSTLLVKTIHSVEHYRKHPEEKPAVIQQANKLFEDWKKARKESNDYHNWRKTREFSIGESKKDSELFAIQYEKSQELLFFCLEHVIEETRNILYWAMQVSKTEGESSV
ncbi:hypothetical protein [Candidatus Nitrosotenuis aquarius]|uniref:hypothetical protein n=1 Tax=Candidatus Nitrosotenuis aquarius TaxID=1846278 RepID=UPI000C1EDCD7|nr:hypothetical protein [Candidatus Nitrosotenuis aquarius]